MKKKNMEILQEYIVRLRMDVSNGILSKEGIDKRLSDISLEAYKLNK